MDTELMLTNEQQNRISRMRAVCREMSPNSHVQLEKLQHVLVDLRNKMLVCAPPNVGSNSLKHILISAADTPVDLHDIYLHINTSVLEVHGISTLDAFRPVKAKYMLHNFRKVMFVRHPFERLASVHYSKFGKANEGQGVRSNLTQAKIQQTPQNASRDHRRTGRFITFSEFVKYTLYLRETSGSLNKYWKPIHDICLPCSISYDFIGYLDTFINDAQIVFGSLSYTHQKLISRFRDHRRKYNHNTIRQMYRMIPQTDISTLSKVYALDLYMQGYKTDHIHPWWWCCMYTSNEEHGLRVNENVTTNLSTGRT